MLKHSNLPKNLLVEYLKIWRCSQVLKIVISIQIPLTKNTTVYNTISQTRKLLLIVWRIRSCTHQCKKTTYMTASSWNPRQTPWLKIMIKSFLSVQFSREIMNVTLCADARSLDGALWTARDVLTTKTTKWRPVEFACKGSTKRSDISRFLWIILCGF